MKKLNKNQFFQLINIGLKPEESIRLSQITDSDVVEFKIGNKFFYKINDSNHLKNYHEGIQEFLKTIPVNNAAIAYRNGLSYFDLFEPHRQGYYFLRLDILSFFHSIQETLLKKTFSSLFAEEYIDSDKQQTLLDGFIALTTYTVPENSPNSRFRGKTILPIGFKTSPSISNIVFRKLDILIQKYCDSKGVTYTRYADDMLLSSPKDSKFIHSDSFMKEIQFLLSLDGFEINKKKTIIAQHTISINGYIIENSILRISNKKTRIIEKLVHQLEKGKSEQQILEKLFGFKVSPKFFLFYPPDDDFLVKYCSDQLLNKIAGYRSFLISIIKYNDKFICVNDSAIVKYEKLVDALNKHLNRLNLL